MPETQFRRPVPRRTWIDVGSHLGEQTLAYAAQDSDLVVYAFEPNLAIAAKRIGVLPNFVIIPMAVGERDGCAEFHLHSLTYCSSLLPLNAEGVDRWIGGDQLRVERITTVPVIRLDTFLSLMGIEEVDYLKVDAQGADLAVVRSAGKALSRIRRIRLEVQIVPQEIYVGASRKEEVLRFMDEVGFEITACERQSFDQEENLTFVNKGCPNYTQI